MILQYLREGSSFMRSHRHLGYIATNHFFVARLHLRFSKLRKTSLACPGPVYIFRTLQNNVFPPGSPWTMRPLFPGNSPGPADWTVCTRLFCVTLAYTLSYCLLRISGSVVPLLAVPAFADPVQNVRLRFMPGRSQRDICPITA